MDDFEFKLSPEEAAVIAAECSMSLSDNRCSDPVQREKLEQIIAKMAKPFGLDVPQLRVISDSIYRQKQAARVQIN